MIFGQKLRVFADFASSANTTDFLNPSVGQNVYFYKIYFICTTSTNLGNVQAIIFENYTNLFKIQVYQLISFETQVYQSSKTVYGQYFFYASVAIIPIYILTIVIVIILLIETFVIAIKFIAIENSQFLKLLQLLWPIQPIQLL